jgi:hypothetical protein
MYLSSLGIEINGDRVRALGRTLESTRIWRSYMYAPPFGIF